MTDTTVNFRLRAIAEKYPLFHILMSDSGWRFVTDISINSCDTFEADTFMGMIAKVEESIFGPPRPWTLNDEVGGREY